MKKNLLALLIVPLILFLEVMPSSSQNRLQDVIYMKDGSIFRGIIREQGLNEVKIEITGGTLFVLSKDKIESMTQESPMSFDGTSYRQKKFGYFNMTEMGALVGSTQEYTYWYSSETKISGGFSAQSIHGYRFFSHYLVGAGTAIDLVKHPMLQFFADARYELLQGQATPFAYADLGYNFDLAADLNDGYQKTNFSGGVTWGMGAGMRFNFKDLGAFLFDVGYKLSQRKEEITYTDGNSSILSEYALRRMVIRMGLAF